ncbi:MAG: hypothetical protein JNL72_15110 [Flavipsychrobacter sp.]|nr:hypothetical protein [Flavipsychrobacter sp.]
MHFKEKVKVGCIPTTGVVPFEFTQTTDPRIKYLELNDRWYDWENGSIAQLSAGYIRIGKNWYDTGIGELSILFKQNPKLKSQSAKDKLERKIIAFDNVIANNRFREDRFNVYFNIGHHDSWIEFRKDWRKYVAYFQEVLDVVVDDVLEPEWQDFYPCCPDEARYGYKPIKDLKDVLPRAPYLKSGEQDSLEEDLLWAAHETVYAEEYSQVVKYVSLLMKYGIDTTATASELRNRAYECASLGDRLGRIAFHSLAYLNPGYDREAYDDIFTGILNDHQGKRDIKTFMWCYENIYASQVEAAAKLERDSFNANNIDDEQ